MLLKLRQWTRKTLMRNAHYYVYDPDKMFHSSIRYEPSFGKTGESKIETRIKYIKPIDIEKVIVARKTPRLSILDKWILVKLGKFKKISDVPNTLKPNSRLTRIEKKQRKEIIGDLLETSAKYLFGLQYLLWFVSFCFCVPVFYLSSKKYA